MLDEPSRCLADRGWTNCLIDVSSKFRPHRHSDPDGSNRTPRQALRDCGIKGICSVQRGERLLRYRQRAFGRSRSSQIAFWGGLSDAMDPSTGPLWPIRASPWPPAKQTDADAWPQRPPLFQQHRRARFQQTIDNRLPLCLECVENEPCTEDRVHPRTVTGTAGGASADALAVNPCPATAETVTLNRHENRLRPLSLMGGGF